MFLASGILGDPLLNQKAAFFTFRHTGATHIAERVTLTGPVVIENEPVEILYRRPLAVAMNPGDPLLAWYVSIRGTVTMSWAIASSSSQSTDGHERRGRVILGIGDHIAIGVIASKRTKGKCVEALRRVGGPRIVTLRTSCCILHHTFLVFATFV